MKKEKQEPTEGKSLSNQVCLVIQIVVGTFETVHKNLEMSGGEQEIRGRIETIQTTALLISALILRRVLETWVLYIDLWQSCQSGISLHRMHLWKHRLPENNWKLSNMWL